MTMTDDTDTVIEELLTVHFFSRLSEIVGAATAVVFFSPARWSSEEEQVDAVVACLNEVFFVSKMDRENIEDIAQELRERVTESRSDAKILAVSYLHKNKKPPEPDILTKAENIALKALEKFLVL